MLAVSASSWSTALALFILCLALVSVAQAKTWRGVEVAPESRCSPYDRDDYPYSPAVEARILKRDGGVIRCRYTGQTFASLKGTDIEHVVARSEPLGKYQEASELDVASLENLVLVCIFNALACCQPVRWTPSFVVERVAFDRSSTESAWQSTRAFTPSVGRLRDRF